MHVPGHKTHLLCITFSGQGVFICLNKNNLIRYNTETNEIISRPKKKQFQQGELILHKHSNSMFYICLTHLTL